MYTRIVSFRGNLIMMKHLLVAQFLMFLSMTIKSSFIECTLTSIDLHGDLRTYIITRERSAYYIHAVGFCLFLS